MILNNTVLLKRKPTEQMKIDEKKNTINHRSNLKINNDNIQIKQSMNLKAKKLLEKLNTLTDNICHKLFQS